MTRVRDLNVSADSSGTSFVVYDATNGAARRVSIDSVAQYIINQLNFGNDIHVVSGTYANGTLTLHMSNGTDVVITGWADLDGVTFDGNPVDSIAFNGGLEGKYNTQTKELSVDMISNQAIGNYFLGIYADLASLQAAVRNPKDNYQAIILSPDEEYYHVVGGQWVELAPVVSVHPTYIGSFYTEEAIEAAGGSAENGSLAIVGTADHTFYVKKSGAWAAIKGAVWHKVDGSVSRVNIPADYPATAIPLTVTFPTEITVANTMFMIRHIADTIINGVGLQSYAASGDFPAAASIQLTGTKV